MPSTAKQKRSKGSGTAGVVAVFEGNTLQSSREWPSGASLLVESLSSNIYGILWDLRQLPSSVKFRTCFQAGSDIHTRWDTPPGSETTPSCGWYAHHARRSGRNWTTLVPPRGRWHTGMWSLCRWHTVCHGPRSGSGCSTRQTLQTVGDGRNKTNGKLVLQKETGHGE